MRMQSIRSLALVTSFRFIRWWSSASIVVYIAEANTY
jgi:hypothetical protein